MDSEQREQLGSHIPGAATLEEAVDEISMGWSRADLADRRGVLENS